MKDKIWDIEKSCYIEEHEESEQFLKFLYTTFCGRVLLKFVYSQRWFSKLVGIYLKSSLSLKKLYRFSKKHHIDNIKQYKSFNDYFIRKENSDFSTKCSKLVSPCQGKLSIYPIDKDLHLEVKDSIYTLNQLIDDEIDLSIYKGGYAFVFRLSQHDYHRYHFIDDGKITYNKKIKGCLHTVRPIASGLQVFHRNSREVTCLDTDNFGKVIQIEVGAMLVGKINNHDLDVFKKGQEKGYFEYGGSTVILLLPANSITLNKDIELHIQDEIKVTVGKGLADVKKN